MVTEFSRGSEDARVADEEFVVLEMRAVVGVRVQDELGVRPGAGQHQAADQIRAAQGAHEVLEEHQRRTPGDPETTVREPYSAALRVPGRGGVMRELIHDTSVLAGRGLTVSVR